MSHHPGNPQQDHDLNWHHPVTTPSVVSEQTRVKGEEGGSSTIERETIRATVIPSPLYLLNFHRKDGIRYTEKNNNTMWVHDTREWTKGIQNTSIKPLTDQ